MSPAPPTPTHYLTATRNMYPNLLHQHSLFKHLDLHHQPSRKPFHSTNPPSFQPTCLMLTASPRLPDSLAPRARPHPNRRNCFLRCSLSRDTALACRPSLLACEGGGRQWRDAYQREEGGATFHLYDWPAATLAWRLGDALPEDACEGGDHGDEQKQLQPSRHPKGVE